jgi:hypothetical protein
VSWPPPLPVRMKNCSPAIGQEGPLDFGARLRPS